MSSVPTIRPAAPAQLLGEGASLRLCEIIAGLSYEDLPGAVVATLKVLIIDALGVIGGASRAGGIAGLYRRGIIQTDKPRSGPQLMQHMGERCAVGRRSAADVVPHVQQAHRSGHRRRLSHGCLCVDELRDKRLPPLPQFAAPLRSR